MCGEYIYADTINRSPTAADGLPITLLTVCENAMFENENYSFISQKRGFINRKSLFRYAKQALLFF
ncbi:smAll protein a [Prevotella pallens ATCC 700821]|uniref:SmAll protein a n=1 Tax=Prevotella pallens ATCC 700821 TaxID=997353 RepID=F9DKJ7_9BACT|nr:smAll protein a [Prevotella pallens ATCC 700821]